MSFLEAVMAQPPLVTYWVLWLAFITTVSWIVLFFSRETRRDAAILFLVGAAVTTWMQWIYATEGFVRLLGLPHVVLWTPTLIYLGLRVFRKDIRTPFRQVIYLVMVSMAASLVFDYVDVIRYFLGEKQPITTT